MLSFTTLVLAFAAGTAVQARHSNKDFTVRIRDGPALPTFWSNKGCYTDAPDKRTLNDYYGVSSTNTPLSCISTCGNKGFKYAGVEYGQECFCSNQLKSSSNSSGSTGKAAAQSDCNTPCSGDGSQTCGAGYRINIYQYSAPAIPQGWKSKGCFSDSQDKRALSTLISSSDNNYPARCISQCAAAGYSLAGVEYGRECWCSNELVHSRKNPDTGNGITDSECNQPCTGDSTATCGAGGKVFVYSNQS